MTFRFTPSDDVRHAIDDGVLFVTVDRADKRNPLSLGVLDSIRRIFSEAASDVRISVAVVTGAGDKAFASGGDLAELAAYRTQEEAAAFSRHGKAALHAIRLFPVPVVARLNGVALGGGAELAVACDLRYAAASAQVGFVHGQLCISPSWGGGNDLARLLGPSRALQLMATATILNAKDAYAVGIVDAVCPTEAGFDAWFNDQLSVLRRRPRQVMRAFKAIAHSAAVGDRGECDRRETAHFAEVWSHQDHWDAVARLFA